MCSASAEVHKWVDSRLFERKIEDIALPWKMIDRKSRYEEFELLPSVLPRSSRGIVC